MLKLCIFLFSYTSHSTYTLHWLA